ncbi:nuclear transport factor 2 family protein [Christiangramia sp. SM2212]|uniref:Nuclear transport factor 2 family protein n=1 Tax=Christiangramia sediminicola TaxID=3073267 RepID=A0ABU1EQR9_9FLAO|nr:nuclear transport factor 2 family protein [Christiangramia sp. SM2212]MDR5590741.1 nuclear transport factor 2 family protein [Christiangramia sp. SM2212]
MKTLISIFVLLMSFSLVTAQESEDSELFRQLKAKDSLLFDLGFNQCKIDEFIDFISEDLEFYHDQAGLDDTKEGFLEAVRNNICGNIDRKPIRKLLPGTLEVYPLYDNGKLYGALQKGVHEFFIKEPNKELYKTSSAKFTHVWLLKDGDWILKRVLSYDHKSSEK